MTRYELINRIAILHDKLDSQNALIKEQKKSLKNGGDDGEGGKTYKQLYELRNAEFETMVQERDRFAGKVATLEIQIVTLTTAEAEASLDKKLFQKDMDAKTEMLKKVEADNDNYKNHFFRNQHQSAYGVCGSMSALGPSPG